MRKLCYIFVMIVSVISSVCVANAEEVSGSTPGIREALKRHRESYPTSHLRDVYKNFMQDYFGPGHLLADTAAAGRYLLRELAETALMEGPDSEPTGFEGNFVRVNLRLIAEGRVPYDTFFSSFVRSVQGIAPPSAAEWTAIWSRIESEIEALGYHYDDEQADRAYINDLLKEEKYVVHHSDAYNETVNFHYRIMSRKEFEENILPLLTK
ncbi:MAG: hypothetical protein HDS73_02695 [Bacteroidales bacterium]|nr:hypothetical protein [Bacteroidales bacterium]